MLLGRNNDWNGRTGTGSGATDVTRVVAYRTRTETSETSPRTDAPQGTGRPTPPTLA